MYFVEDREVMLRQWLTRLKPGGWYAEVPDRAADARQVLPFFTPLMMRGYNVTQEGELVQQLRAVGFEIEEVQRLQPFPMSPLDVILARKPKTSG